MPPEQLPIGQFVQFRDTDAVFIRLRFLGDDVHGYLRQVQIGSDPGGRCDACIVKNFPHHSHGQLVRRHPVGAQVIGQVDKYLVNGINDNVFWRDVFEVGGIDPA